MTSLLPPNLLRLFAPRPQPQFLRPLTKDEADRGPNRLRGCGELVSRLKEEAEEAELKEGLADAPATVKEEIPPPTTTATTSATANGASADAEKMDVDPTEDKEAGEVVDASTSKKEKSKSKGKGKARPERNDKVAQMGLVGQEAIKMRKELRIKRQAEYKKALEKNCRSSLASVVHQLMI